MFLPTDARLQAANTPHCISERDQPGPPLGPSNLNTSRCNIAAIERRVRLLMCVVSTNTDADPFGALWLYSERSFSPAWPQCISGAFSPFVMDINTVAEQDLLS